MKEDDAADDAELFRSLLGDARPLKHDIRAPDYKPKPKPKARFRRQDELSVLQESIEADIDEIETGAGEALRFHRPAVGQQTLRKLARGKFAIQNEIDLHGMTVPEAKAALREFVNKSVCRGLSGHQAGHNGQFTKREPFAKPAFE